MDIITTVIGLPFAPVQLVLAVARVLQDQAEQEMYSPAAVRRELEEIEQAQASDELPEEEAEEAKESVLSRLTEGR
jgi:hypothetical protein